MPDTVTTATTTTAWSDVREKAWAVLWLTPWNERGSTDKPGEPPFERIEGMLYGSLRDARAHLEREVRFHEESGRTVTRVHDNIVQVSDNGLKTGEWTATLYLVPFDRAKVPPHSAAGITRRAET